jgi:hypothetical protein
MDGETAIEILLSMEAAKICAQLIGNLIASDYGQGDQKN